MQMTGYIYGLLILTGLSLAVIAVRLLFRHKLGRLKVRHLVRVACIIILHVGVLLVLGSFEPIYESLERFDWPAVTARIISSEIVEPGYYRPEVKYSYSVAGREYEGHTDLDAPGFGSKSKRFQAAEAMVAAHQPGDTLIVFYNPDRPAESRRYRQAKWNLWMELSLGGMLFVAGLFVALLPRQRKRPKKSPVT